MNWYLDVLKKFAEFKGRARRTEYWMFVLVNIGVSIVLGLIGAILGTDILGTLYGLAILVPSIAVSVRRLHDTDRSGWWALIGLVPVVGWIILIVFAAQEGTKGPNQYGPDPKESTVDSASSTDNQ